MLRSMSFIKVNLVLKTDWPTDRPTDLGIETTCRCLKMSQPVLVISLNTDLTLILILKMIFISTLILSQVLILMLLLISFAIANSIFLEKVVRNRLFLFSTNDVEYQSLIFRPHYSMLCHSQTRSPGLSIMSFQCFDPVKLVLSPKLEVHRTVPKFMILV